MMEIKTVTETIEQLFKDESGYKIAKFSGLPYQTVQDLRNGTTKLEDAKFKTIIKLYEYALSKQGDQK